MDFVRDFAADLVGKHAEAIYDAYLKGNVGRATSVAAVFATGLLERFGEVHQAWIDTRWPARSPYTPPWETFDVRLTTAEILRDSRSPRQRPIPIARPWRPLERPHPYEMPHPVEAPHFVP